MVSFQIKVTSMLMIAILSCSQAAGKVRYDGYKVFRATPVTREQVVFLQELEKLGVFYLDDKPSRVNHHVDLVFPPHLQGDELEQVRSFAMEMEVEETIPDLQKLIDSEVVNQSRAWTGWTSYQLFDNFMEFLQTQQHNHPGIAIVFHIGNSYEGRPLDVLKISTGWTPTKRVIWIDANVHAREWVTGMVAAYVIDQLLNSGSEEVKGWLDDFEFYIIPIANPDGFVFTQAISRIDYGERLEHRQVPHSVPAKCDGCRGIDPNRNWDYKWQSEGGSHNPCDETYAGPEPWSEPEVTALRDFLSVIHYDVDLFITIHSYSQLVLFPYGVEDERLDDDEFAQHTEVGNKVADALQARHGMEFKVGSIFDILYLISGGSTDWIKKEFDTDLVFAFELRDQGRYGFLLPADQIIPSAEEFMDGLGALVSELRARHAVKNGTHAHA